MAERTLKKRRRPDLPVLLVRPSIISGAWKEPVPGWTDTISAAGGISLGGGIGIINWVHGHGDNLADLVPVDIVSNIIIAGSALQAGD
jgi:alcohol-forming fatty acyl-CoA reductase